MGLRICANCERETGVIVDACPHCGAHPFEDKNPAAEAKADPSPSLDAPQRPAWMKDGDERRARTAEAFANPRPGMRFHEMYSFWVHVVHVDPERVIVEEYKPPCVVPDDAKVRVFASHDEFRKAYAYGTIPGYSTSYADDKAPFDHHKAPPKSESPSSPERSEGVPPYGCARCGGKSMSYCPECMKAGAGAEDERPKCGRCGGTNGTRYCRATISVELDNNWSQNTSMPLCFACASLIKTLSAQGEILSFIKSSAGLP